MPQYMLAYHGGSKPATQEQGASWMGEWKNWAAALGEALVNPGTPLGMSKTVSATGVTDDGGPNPLMGYSIVVAKDMPAALAIAKTCPHVHADKMNGSIEIAELKSM